MLIEKNSSQKDLAEYLGLHKQAVSNWKNGSNKSYIKHINKIAEYFNVSTDYLLNNENIPKEEYTNYPIYKLADDLEKIFIKLNVITPGQDLTPKQYQLLISYITGNITANADILKNLINDVK